MATALDIFEKERIQRPIPTFSRRLDSLLGGGIFSGPGIFEVCGAPGAGKTQLCMQMCVNVQVPPELGSKGRKAIYIDTEGSFLVERVAQLARGLCDHITLLANNHKSSDASVSTAAQTVTVKHLLEGIYVFRVFDHLELLAVVLSLENFILETTSAYRRSDPQKLRSGPQVSEIGMVVIDSISFPYRHPFSSGGGDVQLADGSSRIRASAMAERTSQLLNLANNLNRIAHRFDIAVIIANQMTTKILPQRLSVAGSRQHDGVSDADRQAANAGSSSSRLEPALGASWAHVPTTRVIVERSTLMSSEESKRGARVARLVKSNFKPPGVTYFQIHSHGIRDCSTTSGS